MIKKPKKANPYAFYLEERGRTPARQFEEEMLDDVCARMGLKEYHYSMASGKVWLPLQVLQKMLDDDDIIFVIGGDDDDRCFAVYGKEKIKYVQNLLKEAIKSGSTKTTWQLLWEDSTKPKFG